MKTNGLEPLKYQDFVKLLLLIRWVGKSSHLSEFHMFILKW